MEDPSGIEREPPARLRTPPMGANGGLGGNDGAVRRGRVPVERPPDPLIGRVIADRYRIVGQVGRGGMGVVYKVEHLRIGKLMAMKLLTGELSRNRDVVRRFKREALAASRLTSVNTVQVWDFGHSDGLTYLVMELVNGEDFGKILSGGAMPFQRVAQIAVQVCNSMIEAHSRGIVHRDIKPENILILHPEGSRLHDLVKVLDFGLAKLHEDDRAGTQAANPNDITTTGAIVGTPYYMAPEQIRGEPVDGRTDIYALGAVMYRAVTGHPPFIASNPMAVLTAHLTETLIPPPERAPELEIAPEASEIIERALEKDRAQRWESAIALREALIAWLARTGTSGGFLSSGAIESAAEAVPVSVPDTTVEGGRSSGVELGELPATRGEVDAYARGLKRKGMVAAIALLALGGSTAWAVRGWRQHLHDAQAGSATATPTLEEREPNDSPPRANALTLGTPVSGYIGKRISPEHGDVDVYMLDLLAHGGERPLIEIDLTPLPNIPLCLTVTQLADGPSGEPVGIFCRPRGQRLHIDARAVKPGRIYLAVEQDRAELEAGTAPPVHENVSDTYSLRVALTTPGTETEIEPNDTLAAPQTIAPAGAVRATIGWRGDVDVFCAAAEGTGEITIVDRATRPRPHGSMLEAEAFVGDGGRGKQRIPLGGTWKSGRAPPGEARRCVVVRLRTADGTTPSGTDDGYRVSIEPNPT